MPSTVYGRVRPWDGLIGMLRMVVSFRLPDTKAAPHIPFAPFFRSANHRYSIFSSLDISSVAIPLSANGDSQRPHHGSLHGVGRL